jgi:hypothetical protein
LTLLLPIIPGTDPQLIFDAFQKNAQTIGMALNEMQLVHYLRLLVLDRSQPNLQLTATPNLDTLVLAVITNYDNSFEFYIQQFAQHLGAFYTEVLQYIVGGSAVGDVTNNQQAFIDFVKSHDASQPTNTPPPPPSLSAYPSLQVPTIWSNAGWAFPTSPPSTTTTASPATPSATAAGS